jgi:hypothetical protein
MLAMNNEKMPLLRGQAASKQDIEQLGPVLSIFTAVNL